MDGAFVAYHNTAKMFGFQYITLDEIDHRIYGSSEMANWAFDTTCKLLQDVVRIIDQRLGDRGDLLLLTTIGPADLHFYAMPKEADENEPVLQLKLNLRREVGGKEVSQEDFVMMESPHDLQIWSAITESEVDYSHFKKYLTASEWVRQVRKPKENVTVENLEKVQWGQM